MTAGDRSLLAGTVSARVAALDWGVIASELDRNGAAVAGPLLTPSECDHLIALYDQDAHFRSRIVMARHGFGSGEYKYLDYPLPAPVQELREALYSQLAPIASDWVRRMGGETQFPGAHADFLDRCRAAGQVRPTPLILKYQAGDYNCLHQDLYGDTVFPIQVAILLSQPVSDFTGGEFLVVEQRPRMQSRPEVVSLGQGEAVIFAVNERPVAGSRGDYRVKIRHGVSRVRSGRRHTLGVIFHDAS
jgi:hypothetical protein